LSVFRYVRNFPQNRGEHFFISFLSGAENVRFIFMATLCATRYLAHNPGLGEGGQHVPHLFEEGWGCNTSCHRPLAPLFWISPNLYIIFQTLCLKHLVVLQCLAQYPGLSEGGQRVPHLCEDRGLSHTMM